MLPPCNHVVMMSDATTPGHSEIPPQVPLPQAKFGMKRAAEVAGVSVSTIRRNKELLRKYGAVISPEGWEVPISALVASGLMRRQTPPDAHLVLTSVDEGPQKTEGQETVRRLEREVLELRHRAELAEERQRSAEQRAQDARELADTLSETLKVERRMLTSAPTPAPETRPIELEESNPIPTDTPTAPVATTGTRSSRISWWQRIWG